MLNILKSLTEFLLRHEEETGESCDIPDESIEDWVQTVEEEIRTLSGDPGAHRLRLEQLQAIARHLKQIQVIRARKCNPG